MAITSMCPTTYTLLLLLASLISSTTAAFAWDSFPTCTQPILQHYAPGTCDLALTGNDLNRTNNCLCSNRDWIDASAVGIYIVCGCDALSLTAEQLTQNCNSTNTPAISSQDDYISIGSGGLSTCTPAPFSVGGGTSGGSGQNCSSGATVDSNQSQNCPGTDSGLIVALAIGVPSAFVAGIAALIALLQLLVTHRKWPENGSPWPIIRDSFRAWFCCCRRKRHKRHSGEAAVVKEGSDASD
jgi:hypothetical protein